MGPETAIQILFTRPWLKVALLHLAAILLTDKTLLQVIIKKEMNEINNSMNGLNKRTNSLTKKPGQVGPKLCNERS